jgi:hypothetical protein
VVYYAPRGRRRPPSGTRRLVSVPEAAEILGITVEAVRGRIKRVDELRESGALLGVGVGGGA